MSTNELPRGAINVTDTEGIKGMVERWVATLLSCMPDMSITPKERLDKYIEQQSMEQLFEPFYEHIENPDRGHSRSHDRMNEVLRGAYDLLGENPFTTCPSEQQLKDSLFKYITDNMRGLRVVSERMYFYLKDFNLETSEGVKIPFTLLDICLYANRFGDNDPRNMIRIHSHSEANFDLRHDFFHPHVDQEEYMCIGDATRPLLAMARAVEVVGYLGIIKHMLETYNPDSPYRKLEEWRGEECSNCGTRENRAGDMVWDEASESHVCNSCVAGRCRSSNRVLLNGDDHPSYQGSLYHTDLMIRTVDETPMLTGVNESAFLEHEEKWFAPGTWGTALDIDVETVSVPDTMRHMCPIIGYSVTRETWNSELEQSMWVTEFDLKDEDKLDKWLEEHDLLGADVAHLAEDCSRPRDGESYGDFRQRRADARIFQMLRDNQESDIDVPTLTEFLTRYPRARRIAGMTTLPQAATSTPAVAVSVQETQADKHRVCTSRMQDTQTWCMPSFGPGMAILYRGYIAHLHPDEHRVEVCPLTTEDGLNIVSRQEAQVFDQNLGSYLHRVANWYDSGDVPFGTTEEQNERDEPMVLSLNV